jgi:hypothetical protein
MLVGGGMRTRADRDSGTTRINFAPVAARDAWWHSFSPTTSGTRLSCAAGRV